MLSEQLAEDREAEGAAEDRAGTVETDDKTEPSAKAKAKAASEDNQEDPLTAMLCKFLPAEKVKPWAEVINRTFNAHITLITECAAMDQFKEKLKETDAFKMRGVSGTSYFGIFYCFSTASESTSSPHKRSPPYQDSQASKLVHAVLEARSDTGTDKSIAHGDMYFFSDNGKHGLGSKLMSLCRWAAEVAENAKKEKLPVKVKPIRISYNEHSARQRKRATRGFSSLKHTETLYILTKKNIDLPVKQKAHFPGTNQGETFENVILPTATSMWSMSVKNKKLLYGTKRVRPGGPQEDDDDELSGEDEQDAKRTDETIEPAFFHPLTYETNDECVQSYNLNGVLDLTADNGDRAIACVSKGILYTGVCLTAHHLHMLKYHTMENIYNKMITEGSHMFQPKLAAAVKEHVGEATQNKRKKNEDSKKDKKKSKKSESSSSSSEDSHDSDS